MVPPPPLPPDLVRLERTGTEAAKYIYQYTYSIQTTNSFVLFLLFIDAAMRDPSTSRCANYCTNKRMLGQD